MNKVVLVMQSNIFQAVSEKTSAADYQSHHTMSVDCPVSNAVHQFVFIPQFSSCKLQFVLDSVHSDSLLARVVFYDTLLPINQVVSALKTNVK